MSDGEEEVKLQFSFLDYAIFVLLMGLSALIGLYYGFISKRKQDNTEEYLLGGKKLSIFPVAMSLIASHISGIALLGIPSEMYMYGTQFAMFVACCFTVGIAMWFVYLPVFHELQMTSCFLYLERRFDRRVRLTASFFYAVSVILFVPIVLFMPALAFNQTTGINIHYITPIACIVCIFYTTFGGLRAVVWTDSLQFVSLVGATVVVIFFGLKVTGGFAEVWKAADRGGRLVFFNLDPNPFVRNSFWSVVIGMSMMYVSLMGVNQSSMQRFLAVPDLRKARQTLISFTCGQIFIKLCCCAIGLIIYARYESCDPLTAKKIKKVDQILPYFVMDVARHIPGMPGLFIAGIFSAALSTMSSCWNTLAGTIYEDFIRYRMPTASEERASNIMKMIVVILGCVTIGLVFVVERMGTILSFTISIQGLTAGTMLGIFTFGMFFRQGNTKGVISGAITAFVVLVSIIIGANNKKYPGLPLRIDGCSNETISSLDNGITKEQPEDDRFILFKLSNMYYTLVGLCIVFSVAYVVSILTGGYEVKDERLFTPWMRDKKAVERELLEDIRKNTPYLTIHDANKVLDSKN